MISFISYISQETTYTVSAPAPSKAADMKPLFWKQVHDERSCGILGYQLKSVLV